MGPLIGASRYRLPLFWLLWVAGFAGTSAENISREETGDPYAMYEGRYVLKLKACDQETVDKILVAMGDTGCDFLSEEGILELPREGCGEEWVICSAAVGDKLVANYGAEIESKNAGTYFRDSGGNVHAWNSSGIHAQSEFYTSYRSLAAIEAKLVEIVAGSNGIATLEELSPKTHEGRSIKAIRIRDKQWKSGRPRVVFTFQQHAREWVAGMTGVYTAEFLINALKSEPDFVQGMEVVLVPLSNPDGFAYSATNSRFWRKNRRNNNNPRCAGVDLNRNWGKDWGGPESTTTNMCLDTYIGPSRMSEPETKALASVIEEAPVNVHIDIHCFSELILGPWSYTETRHPNKAVADELGLAMQKSIKSAHGKTYAYGTGGEVIYLASGVFPDWTGERWPKALGYCYELRPGGRAGRNGFSPPASEILPSAEEAIQGLYTAIDWAKDQGEPLAPPAPPPPPPTKPPAGRRRRRRSGSKRRRRGSTRRRRRRSSGSEPSERRRRRSGSKPTPAPTPAPTPRPPAPKPPLAATQWQCSVCGYGPISDAEYQRLVTCPRCGKPKSVYKPV